MAAVGGLVLSYDRIRPEGLPDRLQPSRRRVFRRRSQAPDFFVYLISGTLAGFARLCS